MSDTDEDVCGEARDHRLRLMWDQDGMRCYECDECGAEIVEEVTDDE